MKTDRSGAPDVAARVAPSAAAAKGKSPRRRLGYAAVVLALVALLAVITRHALVGLVLTRGLDVLTGDTITIGAFGIGSTSSTMMQIDVRGPGGEPLFAAGRLTLHYSLRDLLPGGVRRFGLCSVLLEHPVLTVVRRRDGSYNLGGSGAAGNGSTAVGGSTAPWNLDLAVRDGEIVLRDAAPVAADLGHQRIVRVAVTAEVRGDRPSFVSGGATFIGRQTATSALRAWPLTLGGTLDYARGLALARFRAEQLPVRGPMGFLIHGKAVRVEDGVLHDVDLKLFALDIRSNRSLTLHAGGSGVLSTGRLAIGALARPVRRMRGRLTLTDDGIWVTRLDAELAGLPLVARGGIFGRRRPTLRLGIAADGDLHDLRTAFAFARRQPVAGRAHIETVLEAPIADILVRSGVQLAHGSYGAVPLTAVAGQVDYHAGAVVLDGLRAGYGRAALTVGGRFVLGGSALDSVIVADARARGHDVPFAENLAPEAGVDIVALIYGGAAGYRTNGTVNVTGQRVSGRGMFVLDERGVGEYGPFSFARADGSSLAGTLRIERPTSRSAGWISARRYRIAVPATAARLVGLNVPAFPPVAGIIDGDLAGGVTPDAFALGGTLRGQELRVGTARLGAGHAALSGTLSNVRIGAIALDGPLGRFRGSGAVARGAFALQGFYDGSLERLAAVTGNQQGHGAVRGHVLATFAAGNVVVQSSDAALHSGLIHGVALDTAAGTIAVRQNVFHLIVASGSVLGRRAVAADAQGRIAVSAPDVPSEALGGTGLPLQAGNISAYGLADLRGKNPGFVGTIAVAGGRARGYPVTGDAQIDLAGSRARIFAATGALGSTFGSIGGSISGIGAGTLGYDLQAHVPLGDVDLLRHDLSLPIRHLAGSFAADLHVHGSGNRPMVDGRVAAPEGIYNGLAFRDAVAHVALAADGIGAHAASITVGSTVTALDVSAAGGAFDVRARSSAIDLADFNDYFDASSTLAGRGSFDLAARTDAKRIVTRGDVDVHGLRYRDYAVGDSEAHWQTHGAGIAGSAELRSPAGSLAATATIYPAAADDPLTALRQARYEARGTFSQIELGFWLPVAGLHYPVLGRVDAHLTVAGRLPRIAVATDLRLNEASVAGYAVHDAYLRASAVGSRINVAASHASIGQEQLAANGILGLRPHDPLAFDLRVTSPDISGAIRRLVPAARDRDIAGALDADVRVAGTRALPSIAGGFDLRGARYGGLVIPRAIGALALAGRAIELRDADVEFARGQAFVAGSLPLVFAPFGLGPPHAPLSFDVTARGVDLAQFMPLFPTGTVLGGTVDGRFGVEGTVDRPRLLGALAISGGSYTSPFERAPIEHVGANLAFAGSSIALQAFHADVGGGTLDGSGRITLPIGDQAAVRYQASASAKAAKLEFPNYGRGTVDGDLRLTGGSGQPVLSGDIALRDAVIPVSAVYGGAAGGAGSAGGPPIDPVFHLHALAANNVRVRSSIVDIGVTGAVDVSGTLRAPQLAGGFNATDGTISSYNHTFRIVNAAVTFNPADGVVPTIEARAISRVSNPDPDPSRNIGGSANIIVTVSGTADSNNLQVTYSSDPAYSQEQIIGLLLDVPALLGAVNFNLNGGTGSPLLRGAPGETNALLPPGVTPEQVSAISFNEEVFSLLNGQFTQRALSPIERAFERVLDVSDIEFTVDYGGGIGYSLRRQIGKRDFYAFLSQTVTYPERANIGFELVPKPFETINFSYYQQNGVTSLITNATPGEGFLSSTRRLTSVQPLGNRSGFSINLNRRF